MRHLVIVLLALFLPTLTSGAEEPVEFHVQARQLEITVGGKPFATYVYRDDKIRRPFFAYVHAPNGVQVTRNHPPVPGQDATDHATMHPGIWLAFGDLSGADFWRNKAIVRHVEFVGQPKRGNRTGNFVVRNLYEAGGKAICDELCRITIRVKPHGYLLLWDSEFTSNQDFFFGDQEEMGLGVRVATPISVKKGGQIINSDGLKNERQIWGKQADWCAYSGVVDGKQVGVMLMPHPKNFRRSWFHARDYGLLVANPFGQNAFTKGEKSKVPVKKDEKLRLRFGILIFSGEIDEKAAYQDYLNASDSEGK